MKTQDRRLVLIFILGLIALLLSLILRYLFRDFTNETAGFAGSPAFRSRNEPSNSRNLASNSIRAISSPKHFATRPVMMTARVL